jgi:hypothetical protein
MAEILLAQLNEHWTLVYLSNPGGSRAPGWSIRKAADPRAGTIFRVAHMVREYITFIVAKDGPITPEAQAILAALPPRSDRDATRPPKYQRKRPAKPVDAAPAATVTEQPPAAIIAPSPRIPPVTPAAKSKDAELTAAMKEDRLELIRKAAAADRASLPERISAQRKHHGRWA